MNIKYQSDGILFGWLKKGGGANLELFSRYLFIYLFFAELFC